MNFKCSAEVCKAFSLYAIYLSVSPASEVPQGVIFSYQSLKLQSSSRILKIYDKRRKGVLGSQCTLFGCPRWYWLSFRILHNTFVSSFLLYTAELNIHRFTFCTALLPMSQLSLKHHAWMSFTIIFVFPLKLNSTLHPSVLPIVQSVFPSKGVYKNVLC